MVGHVNELCETQRKEGEARRHKRCDKADEVAVVSPPYAIPDLFCPHTYAHFKYFQCDLLALSVNLLTPCSMHGAGWSRSETQSQARCGAGPSETTRRRVNRPRQVARHIHAAIRWCKRPTRNLPMGSGDRTHLQVMQPRRMHGEGGFDHGEGGVPDAW